ncbi:MAG: 3-phosphoserine/phosphohydroxythreonine transaminase [Deltaproteobacteria bacterium]|nr:3-phosphoserine/phosphohydroxythreonine transaminase [Deltaproteobacteria bacterium]MBW2078340.1 3-phosphoserine/phosphohydroxythreonine transaminase [Deltaproteobacteria bacterium]MBW2309614.1 3-phosphoserine/phosphohydroxythreonine transaminase [Deltaproteobacteria bacterium]RLB28344.1 MAG: 3-phosphoserine/phosphohydroxythreonine transaminase [Deltaproteobacteria bacterium]
MEHRVHNFYAGPAALPRPVLEEIKENFLSFRGSGMSITEISHRSDLFDELLDDTINRVNRLLGLNEGHHVLFIQGGASQQFCMIPMNLALPGKPIDYINTGVWSTKAIKEARIQGKDVRVIATSEDRDFSYVPVDYTVDGDASYLHFTSNNTIMGTQWQQYPDGKGVPLIADMSSDFMSHPIDGTPFGMIYAGAQKNIGPSGLAMVIIRDDMLERVPDDLPTLLKYTTFHDHKSLFNTPPTFTIYAINLVLAWLEETVGGLEEIERRNRQKASLIYELIDNSEIYHGIAEPASRSLMNITFRLPDPKSEQRFLAEAQNNGFIGLKGHRAIGGCRASIYNAVTIDSVKSLVAFMEEFEKTCS